MNNIFLSSGLAFLITYFAIPVIIQIAKEKKLYDEPDERKVHKAVIPTLGGLGIFAGFVIATLMGVPTNSFELQFIMVAIMVIFFIGIKDDILVITASKKFIAQLIAAGIIIKFAGLQIHNMHGFFGMGEIPRIAAIALTIFAVIVITNSFNLIDGVDGLAGSLGLLTSLVFGLYFYITGYLMYSIMAFALSGSLVAFLIYNFSPAKIFMGDTGSLLIGLVNSIFVIKFIDVAQTARVPIQASPAIGFAILIVPLFDTLRVTGMRILKRRSPFSADRNHIHHFLLDYGLSHKMISILCVTVNILFIALALSLKRMGTTIVAGALATAAISFIGIIYYKRPKRRYIREDIHTEETYIKPRKVISLAGEVLDAE
jgi:UDP-GlcNAc:undecaprenyl-phosphate/decaprenyl-phosphate GlcNAc-1-phosphate transferase